MRSAPLPIISIRQRPAKSGSTKARAASASIGTRDIISTPPASMARSWPAPIFRAAAAMASIPDEQKRLTVIPLMLSGQRA